MPVILVDVNLEGHAARIWKRMQAPAWRELTALLEIAFCTFPDVSLASETPDDIVWRFCHEHEFYLLTSNRNEDAVDSLEATIRHENTLHCLPVFTLPLPDRVNQPAFLERVIDKLLDFLMFSDTIRGAGRLYLP